MKRILTILLVFISSIIYILFGLLSLHFHFGYLYYYEFYTTKSVVVSIIWVAVLLILSIIFVLLIRFAFENKKILLLVGLIIIFSYLSVYCFFSNAFGYNGCDYTEDLANYHRFGANLGYFPEEITDDFEVIDYSYYHTLLDREHTEIYLEVRFDDLEVMDKYLTNAISAFHEYGVQKYQNPFDPTYTDIIANTIVRKYVNGEAFSAYINFSNYERHKYVDAYYRAISYSYDDLSIIFVYLDIGSDISIKEYYPKYLRRFDVEWNSDLDFNVQYTKIEKTPR